MGTIYLIFMKASGPPVSSSCFSVSSINTATSSLQHKQTMCLAAAVAAVVAAAASVAVAAAGGLPLHGFVWCVALGCIGRCRDEKSSYRQHKPSSLRVFYIAAFPSSV